MYTVTYNRKSQRFHPYSSPNSQYNAYPSPHPGPRGLAGRRHHRQRGRGAGRWGTSAARPLFRARRGGRALRRPAGARPPIPGGATQLRPGRSEWHTITRPAYRPARGPPARSLTDVDASTRQRLPRGWRCFGSGVERPLPAARSGTWRSSCAPQHHTAPPVAKRRECTRPAATFAGDRLSPHPFQLCDTIIQPAEEVSADAHTCRCPSHALT